MIDRETTAYIKAPVVVPRGDLADRALDLVIVLGGAGNYPGALLGGLLLGLVEQLSSLFLTTQVNEAVAYVLLVLVLLIRPTGLLKGRV